jgi:hypothetical protein
MWKEIVKGHNDFSNKRCPCFRSKEALSGTLGTNLRKKLAQIFRDVENSSIVGINNMNQYILNTILKGKGFKVIPSPYSEDALASGISTSTPNASNSQIITPPTDDMSGAAYSSYNDYT